MNPVHHAPAQGPVRQDRLYVGGEWLDPWTAVSWT